MQLLMQISKSLEKRLCNFLSAVQSQKTFDDLVLFLKPTYFHYEFLLDYLLEFSLGQFKFKSEICHYFNTFCIQFNGRKMQISLQGKKLDIIQKNNLRFNNNLFLPLDFDDKEILLLEDCF